MEMKLNINDAFDHLAGLGVALWADEYVRANPDETQPVLLHWKDNDTFVIECGNHDDAWFADAVQWGIEHHQESNFLSEVLHVYDYVLELNPKKKRIPPVSPLSPRRKPPWDETKKTEVERYGFRKFNEEKEVRALLIDAELMKECNGLWLTSQRLATALGQPGYWCVNDKKDVDPNSGATYWEMADTGSGRDFVHCRMFKMLGYVSGRDDLLSRLVGEKCVDDCDKEGKMMTPTGLRARSKADNVRAWCAFWALSLIACRPVADTCQTAHSNAIGAFVSSKAVFFYLPVLSRNSTLGRYRVVFQSAAALRLAQSCVLEHGVSAADAEWLAAHSCEHIAVFERKNVKTAGNKYQWIDQGRIYPVEPSLGIRHG